MVVVVAQQKGGVGKTTTAANVGVLLARRKGRVLLVDSDPQSALTRQLGLEDRPARVSLVDVLAGRAVASDAIVCDVHGVDVIPGARELAGIEMSLVGELGRELFLRDALDQVLGGYEHVVIDTPPNLGLLTVNALVCAEHVIAPVSAEDEASIHGVIELRQTISRLAKRLGGDTEPVGTADSLAKPSGQQPTGGGGADRRTRRAGGADPVSVSAGRACRYAPDSAGAQRA